MEKMWILRVSSIGTEGIPLKRWCRNPTYAFHLGILDGGNARYNALYRFHRA